MNRIVKEDQKPEKEPKARNRSKLRAEVASVFTGEAFSRANILNNLPFLFFLTFLAVVYIGYGYYASKTNKRIHEMELMLRDLESDVNNEQANLNTVSMQSQIADSTAKDGLRPSMEPPIKIVVSKEEFLVSNE